MLGASSSLAAWIMPSTSSSAWAQSSNFPARRWTVVDGENFFDGAQGDVMRAIGREGRDANFADEDVGALRAKFEDVIDPGGAVAEGGLGDDVEGFERGDGVGGGAGAGGERGQERQRDRGERVEPRGQRDRFGLRDIRQVYVGRSRIEEGCADYDPLRAQRSGDGEASENAEGEQAGRGRFWSSGRRRLQESMAL